MTLHRPYSSSESVLETAGRELLGSITGGGRWVDALDTALPKLNCLGGTLSCIMPPRLFGVPSSDMTETFEAIAAGRTPPLTEATRMIPAPQDGFLCDQMDLYSSRRERDAFYMDFIRPRGLAYQASAYLDGTGSDTVNLMVFRPPGSGGFDPADLHAFKVFLPYIRAAAMASRANLRLEADRRAAPFLSRGDPVLYVAYDGTVRHRSQGAIEILAPDVTLRDGRLAVSAPGFQKKLDGALTTALLERRPSLVTIVTDDARSLRLLVLPVVGQALDVFRATSVLIVVLDITRPMQLDEGSIDLLVAATGLTRRETEIARLVASGHTPRIISQSLSISYETVRLHLKGAFGKLGIHSQAELIALVSRLS
jgi:DNA-binding CsgD family transcriptional regulator